MKFLMRHGLSILAAILMLGGLFFWAIVGVAVQMHYKTGRPVIVGISVADNTPLPTAAPTYIPIPTIAGQPVPTATDPTSPPTPVPTEPATATPEPPPTIAATATPQPTVQKPSPQPTDEATAQPNEPTTVPIAVVPTCPTGKNEVLLIEGTSDLPVTSALAMLYDGIYVGGGTVKPGGLFSIPLANAPRVAGDHTIDVVQRGTENHVHPVFVKRTTCTLAL